jgi:hypothetical protein
MWFVMLAATVVLVVLARLACRADLLNAVRFTFASVKLWYGQGKANMDVICADRIRWYASGTIVALETKTSIAVCTAGMQVASAVVTFVLVGRRMDGSRGVSKRRDVHSVCTHHCGHVRLV